MFTQTTNPVTKSKPQFLKNCSYYHESNHFVSNCFRKQRDDEDRKRKSYSRLKSPVKPINQNFKAYQKQIHPNEQPSSYPVNYYSSNSYDSRSRSNPRNRYSPYRFSRFKSPSTSLRSPEASRSRYCYRYREFNSNRTPSR